MKGKNYNRSKNTTELKKGGTEMKRMKMIVLLVIMAVFLFGSTGDHSRAADTKQKKKAKVKLERFLLTKESAIF